MTDLFTGVTGVKTKIADALRAVEADPEADRELGEQARQAVLDAHLAICLLKAGK